MYEVLLFCDTCDSRESADDTGHGKTLREAVRRCLVYSKQTGFKRTRHGWQCARCVAEKVTRHVQRDYITGKQIAN